MEQNFTSMKQLPDSEKPYEKFLESGAEALSDAELLAVIIRSGTQGKKAIEVAQDFLAQGSRNLLNLYELSFEEMKQVHGIGTVKAIQLKCAAELSKRIAKTRYQDSLSMNHPQTIADYYMERMRHEKQERLVVLFFDSRCRLLSEATVSIGSITQTPVSPREIFLAALRFRAVQIVLLHNHPSGSAQPSVQDDAVTERVRECGCLLEIPLIDHLILGDQSYYSYREHKRILC
mgnify:FL=1